MMATFEDSEKVRINKQYPDILRNIPVSAQVMIFSCKLLSFAKASLCIISIFNLREAFNGSVSLSVMVVS